MSIPSWWPALLLAAAAYRTWRLLSLDTLLDRPRAWLLRLPLGWSEGDKIPDGFRDKWSVFLLCPWCLGFWIALAWWGAWQAWPHTTTVVSMPMALSAFVGLVAKLDSED